MPPKKNPSAAAKASVPAASRANPSRKRKVAIAVYDDGNDEELAGSGPATKKARVAAKAAAPKKKQAAAPAKKQAAPAKKSAAKKAPAKKKSGAAPKRKRGEREDENEGGGDEAPIAKKPKKAARTYGEAPTKPMHVFVFGEGSAGELGLGACKVEGKKPVDVKRPRKNVLLACKTARVVQVACGGMHSVALTKDNRLLTWGVNDQGALGRNTQWDGGLRDVDDEDDSSDDEAEDCGLNPLESTPAEVDTRSILPGEVFVKVAATDSASFALTQSGRLYSWGSFRATDGILGFNKDVLIQRYPVLLPEPVKVTDIATGSNHVVVITAPNHKVFTWGAAEQNQLARRVVERDMRRSALRPGGLSFKRGVKIRTVACGSYHSFAIDTYHRVWAWGLNNFCQLGVEAAGAGEDDAAILKPALVESLADYKVEAIYAGEHHSLARTTDGQLLIFGRVDANQTGLPRDALTEENCIFDDRGNPRILTVPTAVNIPGQVVFAAAGTETSLAITAEGKAYSWGFNANYQCGLGNDDDIMTPTLIDNSAVRDEHLCWAGAGGQFGLLASFADDEELHPHDRENWAGEVGEGEDVAPSSPLSPPPADISRIEMSIHH